MQLLEQCERTARWWGFGSVWLSVSAVNVRAKSLYEKAGFDVTDEGLAFAGPFRMILMRKQIVARAAGGLSGGAIGPPEEDGRPERVLLSSNGPSTTGSEGVYEWRTATAAAEEAEQNHGTSDITAATDSEIMAEIAKRKQMINP